VQGDAWDIGAV